jgi:hypothetical protein
MQTAIIILGIAAFGGLALAGMRLSGVDRPPTWMAVGHGAVAATGLGFLISSSMGSTIPQLVLVSLVLFGLAALGGATLFLGFHLKQKPLPIPLMLGHGLTAIAAYIVLLMSQYGGP